MTKDKIDKPKLEKTWNKEEYIENKFNNRSIVFYIDKSKLFLDISLYLIIIAFVLSLFTTYKVMKLPSKTSYYISSLNGKLYNNDLTEEKRNKLVKAIQEIRSEKNNQQEQK